jgi:putative SOS response-associated peptidase YedK
MTPSKSLAERFLVEETLDEGPRYNIAPTQMVPIIRLNPQTGCREFRMVRWGLIPSWAKDPSIGHKLINARCESVHEKPAFRTAFKFRRCLVPTDGYYDWKKTGKTRQPYLFRMADGSPYAFAGLWEKWKSPEGEIAESCTIITTPANELVASVHDRMPAILKPEDYDTWLDPSLKDPEVLLKLLTPFPSELMVSVPVSSKVNKATYEGPDCIEPITIDADPL